jgi:hypothetical protein
MAAKKRKVGRPRGGPEARTERVTILLTPEEKARFVAQAEALGVPTFLLGRWLITRHPIPGEK